MAKLSKCKLQGESLIIRRNYVVLWKEKVNDNPGLTLVMVKLGVFLSQRFGEFAAKFGT